MVSVKESVCKKTADVGQDSKYYRYPPNSTERSETFGEVIVVGEERAFDSPDAGEKEVGTRPHKLDVGICYCLQGWQ